MAGEGSRVPQRISMAEDGWAHKGQGEGDDFICLLEALRTKCSLNAHDRGELYPVTQLSFTAPV